MTDTHLPTIATTQQGPDHYQLHCAGAVYTVWACVVETDPETQASPWYQDSQRWHLCTGPDIDYARRVDSFAQLADATRWVQQTVYWNASDIDWAPLVDKVLTGPARLLKALHEEVFGFDDLEALDELAAVSIDGPAPKRGSGVPAQTAAWQRMFTTVVKAVAPDPATARPRIEVDLIPEAVEALAAMRKLLRMSEKEIVNRALHLYGYLELKVHDGYTLHQTAPDGTCERLHWVTDHQRTAQDRALPGSSV